jgi:hypothetical protein
LPSPVGGIRARICIHLAGGYKYNNRRRPITSHQRASPSRVGSPLISAGGVVIGSFLGRICPTDKYAGEILRNSAGRPPHGSPPPGGESKPPPEGEGGCPGSNLQILNPLIYTSKGGSSLRLVEGTREGNSQIPSRANPLFRKGGSSLRLVEGTREGNSQIPSRANPLFRKGGSKSATCVGIVLSPPVRGTIPTQIRSNYPPTGEPRD